MAIPKLDMAAAFSMMGLIIPTIIITAGEGVIIEIWSDLTLAISAGCMIFANYTYWLEHKAVGSKIAHPLHIFGSIIGICAGFLSLLGGIFKGVIPLVTSLLGNALNISYGYDVQAIIPIGQICCLIGGIIAIQICSEQLKIAIKGLEDEQTEVEQNPVSYSRNNLVSMAIFFTIIGMTVPDILNQGGQIGIFSLVVPLHYLGLILMGVSVMCLEKLVPKLEALNKIPKNEKPTFLYLIMNVGVVGGFIVGIGTMGVAIIPFILNVFGVQFVHGIFAFTSISLIPVGSLFLFIGGILGIIGFNQLMFKVHDIVENKQEKGK